MNKRDQEADHPDHQTEKLLITDFLTNYNTNLYRIQLQEIANRRRKLFEVYLDDIYDYKKDDIFVSNIVSNTNRYIVLFESIIESLLPISSNDINNSEFNDVFDILQHQRQSMAIRDLQGNVINNNSNNNNTNNSIPNVFLRRFTISFIPLSTQIPRRLRDIKSKDVGNLVFTRGMVCSVSDVKPHISVVTYTCEVCNSESYQEITGHQFLPLLKCTSKSCNDAKTKAQLQMQLRGSKFLKYQELRVQELPEQVPIGNIPRTITIHCMGDHTRCCSPGDIVKVSGILMVLRHQGYRAITAGLQTETYIQASHVEKEKLSYSDISNENGSNIEDVLNKMARHNDPYDILAKSLAPEIYGHSDIKKALLLQLVGGVCRTLPDGVKLRGDINICLMGDPGIAKSQLLKYVATVAPRGVYTTGKGSSGVGLTAAVVRDTATGEMSLEGGALVLADMGVCCIDEFDKMGDSDRTAIHEVMEQQTVSIAKAGISTTLNARTAVLAAANPVYGRYNFRKSISENVNLPNSLLSRFDLLFVLIDKVDNANDIALSKHVMYVHRYLKNPHSDNTALLSITDIKSYIAEVRKLTPMIPRELTSYIVEAYVSLRLQESNSSKHSKSQHISHRSNDQTAMTPRQLLSILRLSQALARLRMANYVRSEDVDEALRLTQASKASLQPDKQKQSSDDYISTIFDMIRDAVSSISSRTISFTVLESMIIKRGFTSEQLRKSLEEYDSLGIIQTDSDMTRITLVS